MDPKLLEALKVILDKVTYLYDEGPLYEGWKSDEFQRALEVAQKAVDDGYTDQ